MGGLARRAAIFQLIAKDHPHVLHLDAGNMFGRRTEAARAQTVFLLDEVEKLGYEVLGVGQWDLNYGLDFLREQAAKHGFHYVCANLHLGDDSELLFDPYAVVKVNGIRVGIISVLGQSNDQRYKIVTMSPKVDDFVVDSPRDALEKYVPELRKKSDLVVLLSNANARDTRQLLLDLGPEAAVDICVEGADSKQYRRLNKVGDTYLVSANPQGKYLGQLDLMLSHDGKIQDAVLKIHELGKQAPEDETIKKRVDTFLEANKQKGHTARLKPTPTMGDPNEHFLGVQRCANCHKKEYEVFRTSAHAKAWQTLVSKGQTNNPECVACHVTGWNWYGGYDPGVATDGRNILFNVQCEACHGYGSEHTRDGQWAKKAKDSCVQCHTEKFDPDFDYETRWSAIAH